MKQVTIIYWSGTGNTEAMATAIAKAVEEAGAKANLMTVSEASVDIVKDSPIVAFGCPAMGAEELEEAEMRPFMDEVNPVLGGKKVALFGSYEWADGEWMEKWEEEIEDTGCTLIDTLIAYDNPDSEALEKCMDLGKKLASA